MRQLTLSGQERHPLEEAFQTTTDRPLHGRCYAILMTHRRRRRGHSAAT
jgi:hypothetical protein